MPSAELTAAQARLDDLLKHPYSPKLKELVEAFIAEMPQIKDDTPRADKVLIHVMRAKAILLLPTYSAEAEADLNKALKLDPSNSADTYVALSECLWRKNQEQEAIDAVQSALGINSKHVPALCQLSRLVRSLASKDASATAEQKADLLQQSIARAKEALAVDIQSGEAWSALGLAHIQVAVATGFGYGGMKKALAAMQQAVKKCPEDPDIHYNYAVVLECTGAYAQASAEYALAATIDPLLKGANKSAENCKLTIERHLSCQREALKNEQLKKEVLFKLPACKANPNGVVTLSSLAELLELTPQQISNAKGHAVALMVVGLISPQGVYPLCYHCVDRNTESCMLLVPRLQPSAVQKRDIVTVTIPPSAIARVEQKDVRVDSGNAAAAGAAVAATFNSIIIAADPDALMVNSVPVPDKLYVPSSMSSRLFQ